jgi:hypothetical protein
MREREGADGHPRLPRRQTKSLLYDTVVSVSNKTGLGEQREQGRAITTAQESLIAYEQQIGPGPAGTPAF